MYPNEYIQYLVHFHGDRDYFECHEILEEYWKKQDFGNKESVWVGFIQLAVSCYHHRRCNFTGAKKTVHKAIQIFFQEETELAKLGLNHQKLLCLLKERVTLIENKQPYKSFNLPIEDPFLIRHCSTVCRALGLDWCSESNLDNILIVHRHKLRDRTDIVQARYQAQQRKKGGE